MSNSQFNRYMDALKMASRLGCVLTESGVVRGEKRWYHLHIPSGELYETSNIGQLEKRLTKLSKVQELVRRIEGAKS